MANRCVVILLIVLLVMSAGHAQFRAIGIVPVSRSELIGDLKMDFRLVTEGPGDVTVSMVRVVMGSS
jgi:hypothetical protein